MSKFRKKSFVNSDLPTSVPDSMYEKLKKRAHDVWDMTAQGDDIAALRKKHDTAQASDEPEKEDLGEAVPLEEMFGPGEIILLLLGGQELRARVAAVNDGLLTLDTKEGPLDAIPASWCRRADPMPMPETGPMSQVSNDIEKMLESRGGHIAVQLGQNGSPILEVKRAGQGIQATLWHISTTAAHNGQYASVQDMCDELSIKGFAKEVPTQSLKPL
jgi:hypothetical protein